MRHLKLASITAVLSVLVLACTAQEPDATSEISEEEVTFELDCDSVVSMHGDLVEDFQADLSPEDAVKTFTNDPGLPQGTWMQLNDTQWVLVNADGRTVGRTTVRVVRENAVETFPEDRYLTDGVEYCE